MDVVAAVAAAVHDVATGMVRLQPLILRSKPVRGYVDECCWLVDDDDVADAVTMGDDGSEE